MGKEINALFVYDGSNWLNPLTEVVGLPIDQINFLACQFFALIFAYFFRTRLGIDNVSATTRHWVQVLVGLALCYFCYGVQIVHLFLQTLISYLLLLTLRPGLMEKAVLLFAVGYLSSCHIYRVVYDYGGWTLDITGPLMVNTQRLTCLAFSLRDGNEKDEAKLSPTMKHHATKRWPRFLEFMSYVMSFQTVICGPFCFYKDYINFIEGTCYSAAGPDKKNEDNEEKTEIPSPARALMTALAWTAGCGLVMLYLIPMYPIQAMMWTDFQEMSFLQKNFYMVLSTTLMRYKYYFAWKLGESVNLSAGLGYNGRSKDGEHRWDLLDNADIMQVECCTSLKLLLDNWNKTTTYWLRYVVYERVHSTLAVFFVSAFWHGFYSGYYITFLSGGVFINAGRIVRRKIRPLFQSSPIVARFYDVVTFLATRLAISYLVFPFVLMEVMPTWRVYKSMYFWYHAGVAFVFIVIPRLPLKSVRTNVATTDKKTDATATNTVDASTDDKKTQ